MAKPTESASVGAVGALFLAAVRLMADRAFAGRTEAFGCGLMRIRRARRARRRA